jgi:uracil-DNA glycosylase family 4
MRQYESFAKEKRFDDLQNAVQYCSICARLAQRTKVLSKSNGYLNTKVLFVAEAPGRLGADRTGVPLHGDRTGDIFESLIANIGWTRDQFFISNALLCNPRDEKGNNCTPTKTEILNCNMYLSMTMEVIQPEVVIPLGNAALDSLSLIAPHNLTLREDVGRLKPWHGKYLFPLYHSSVACKTAV